MSERVYICPKNLYPRPVRWRAGFLMTAPPEHKSALILRHVRDGLGTSCLADAGFTGNQYKLTVGLQACGPNAARKYVKFAFSPHDRPMSRHRRAWCVWTTTDVAALCRRFAGAGAMVLFRL